MPEDPDKAPDNATPAEPVKKKSKWPFLVAGVLLLAVVGGALVWILRSRSGPPETPPPDEPRIKATLHLESFVINLVDVEQRAYLRIGVDIGLSKPVKAKEGEGGPPTALVRDTIVGVLALSKPDELLTADGKNKLKKDLLQALHQRAPELGAQEIYFTEFLIQR